MTFGPIGRRKFIAGALGTAAAARFLAAPALAQGDTVQIGCITSLGGPYALFGEAHVRGMQLAIDMINARGGAGGRMLELVVRDDQLKPDVGMASARELSASGVKIFCGVLSSGVALALGGVMGELDSVLLNCASHGNNLTHEDFQNNYFRVSDYSAMRVGAGSGLMAEKYPAVRNWGVIVPDAEIGRSTLEVMQHHLPKAYQAMHGAEITINEPLWTKFGATDYRNEALKLLQQGIDGLFVGVGGADELTFLQQAGQFGLTKQTKAIYTSGSDLLVPEALKDKTPDNYWTGCHRYYGAYQDNPIAREVIDTYAAKNLGPFPDGFVGMGHVAIYAVAAALATGAGATAAEMIPALEGLEFDSLKGKITLRAEDHQALQDVNYALPAPSPEGRGYKVVDFARVDGAAYAGPATPGQPMKFE